MKDYSTVKDWINNSDAILIGAGAGLSASGGLTYDTLEFETNFPELIKEYGMKDLYSSGFYNFKTQEEKWSYWYKHIDYVYNRIATLPYLNLYKLLGDKNYFIITTNVDEQFLKAGFSKEKIFEVQGNLSKIQCSTPCHLKLYSNLDLVEKSIEYKDKTSVPTNLVPRCPVCKGNMEMNLRVDNSFVEDEYWKESQHNYENFLEENKGKRILLLEFGVGYNTPAIIRHPFEFMTLNIKDSLLVRVNRGKKSRINNVLKEKSISVEMDCGEYIKSLLELS